MRICRQWGVRIHGFLPPGGALADVAVEVVEGVRLVAGEGAILVDTGS